MSLIAVPDPSAGQTAVTRDGNILVDTLRSEPYGLRTIGRAQEFDGGMERANISLNALEKLVSYQATQPGRKLLIWLGPGWPAVAGNEGKLSAKDRDALFQTIVRLSTALREARVTLYNVASPMLGESVGQESYYENFLKGVGSAEKTENPDLALQVLAVQTGGRVLNLSNDLADSIANCLADSKAFYTLSFDSPLAGHPNEYHNLQVKVGRPRLMGRTRTGYYAQP
jgi:VWFA-related protein